MSVTGNDVPAPLHVPDLPDASSAVLSAGEQTVQTVLSSVNGDVTVPIGTSIGVATGAANARIALGELSSTHLPGDLPLGGVGSRLYGRGFYIGPVDATFSPGIDLDVVDDLQVTTPNAQLFRLDDVTGEWSAVAFATAAGGRLSVFGAVTQGGLYAFGVDVAARTVQGRVVDVDGAPVFEALVTVDQRRAITAGDGSFVVDGVPATFGDGSPREALLDVYAGATWLPEIALATLAYSPDPLDVGEIVLDTVRAGNVRVQQVVRARADVFQPSRLSTLEGDVALIYTSDENGQVLFEDVPARFFGFQEGRRRDFRDAFYGQTVTFLPSGQRWLDNYQFLFDRRWFEGTRTVRGYVSDYVGGGPIEFAAVVQGDVPGEGFIGETRESGQLFAERAFQPRLTASVTTARDGLSITHAFTHDLPNSSHLEFPMRRVLRQPLGQFERHGYLTGDVAGVTPGTMHATRVTRRIRRQELWDAVVEGEPIRSSFPIDVGVSDAQPAFRVGVPVAGGNLAMVEYVEQGGRDVLQKAAVLADVREGLVEGAPLALVDPVALAPVQPFRLVDALVGAPSEVDANALTLSLGKWVEGAGVVDVARGIDGSVAAVAEDLEAGLPPLGTDEAWIVLLGGTASSGGVASSHHSMVDLAATTTEGFRFQEFPTLTGPAPGATVSASGFEVQYTLPAGCLGGKLELRSEDPGVDVLLWEVLVRPDDPDFSFITLPVEAETPLVAGRTYTLTVTAWFGDVDIDSPDEYADFVAYVQSVAPVEAGVRQVTSRSIEITTN